MALNKTDESYHFTTYLLSLLPSTTVIATTVKNVFPDLFFFANHSGLLIAFLLLLLTISQPHGDVCAFTKNGWKIK